MATSKKAQSKPKARMTKTPRVASARPKHPLMLDEHSWNKQAVLAHLCDEISGSSRSIASILAAGYEGFHLPNFSTLTRWWSGDDEVAADLRNQYARAKEAQADFMAEELAELHTKAWVPAYDNLGNLLECADGTPMMVVDKSSAAAVRLEADNKKWLMGKMRPKKYGDRVATEVSGPDGAPLQVHTTVTLVDAKPRAEDAQ